MKAAKFLKNLLGIIWWCALFMALSYTYYVLLGAGEGSLVDVLVTVIYFSIFLVGLYHLRAVVRSIIARNPFCFENVTRFRIIGKMVFLIGIVDTIVNYPRPNLTGIRIIGTASGSIKPTVFVYITLGCFALILAEIFKEAIRIKDENDLTI